MAPITITRRTKPRAGGGARTDPQACERCRELEALRRRFEEQCRLADARRLANLQLTHQIEALQQRNRDLESAVAGPRSDDHLIAGNATVPVARRPSLLEGPSIAEIPLAGWRSGLRPR